MSHGGFPLLTQVAAVHLASEDVQEAVCRVLRLLTINDANQVRDNYFQKTKQNV
jgi:hypothetical protein